MQLEDYFDFQRPDDIRVKGTRVGIETILYDFIHRSRTPEEIAQSYPSVTLEQSMRLSSITSTTKKPSALT